MNPYSRLIPRLNGTEIEERRGYYLGLAKKGISGFILFGGELETVRAKVRELQTESQRPLVIASDLEQGLGQQVKGGTLFPPAMAIASAIKKSDTHRSRLLLERLYTAISLEARYAGINTILAPVLDINTNPKNPIIATRAFGEDPETVSFIGCEMLRVFRQNSIMACGKHFPGHGDTLIDSHVGLPVVKKELSDLRRHEFVPFQEAIDVGIEMIMLGHLSVPALDPSGMPASLSGQVVSYLRKTMRFRGAIITDAMNMGAVGNYTEEEASLMALKAGVDLILHPTDPDEVASLLIQKKLSLQPLNLSPPALSDSPCDFREHRRLSAELTEMAVSMEGKMPRRIKKPFLIILNEDGDERKPHFVDAMGERYPDARSAMVLPGKEIPSQKIPADYETVVAIFSSVKAWKTGAKAWLQNGIEALKERATLFVSFGNPYTLADLPGDTARIYAYWDSDEAQKAVVAKLTHIR
ncbi:MAG TPA: glycoside hydrolase family 3 N-terminal domain-containing protein [Thermodesulfovibrionales bacterium]|nr:glycoside hydrolase family 3 N-terminal domain-containing protein [Thermodesulfovibrionales bacterium]